MSTLDAATAVVAAIALFLNGHEGFSRELQAVGGDALRTWLGRITRHRVAGFAIGALSTAVLQSSSAVSSLAAALVDAGAIGFRASLGVVLGANVGTTATAWLVSFKLTGIGPLFIGIGALISVLPWRIRTVGKAVFYFGLIFFALDLISQAMLPLREHPLMLQALTLASSPWIGVLVGALVTAVIQSSSVTSGLAILLVQQGMLPPAAAISIVIGANVGSTVTALIASAAMRPLARSTARYNLAFNGVAALLLLPFLPWFESELIGRFADPGQAVAAAHLCFNLGMALLFLPLLGPLAARIERDRQAMAATGTAST